MKKFILLFAAGALLIPFTRAQDKSAKPALAKKISLGTAWYSGNIQRFDFKFGGEMTHVDSAYEFNLNLNFIYSETDLKVKNREYNGSVKWDYRPLDRISPFLMISGYDNTFKGIGLRWSGLVGAKYKIWHTESSDYSFSAALQGDLERYAMPGWQEDIFAIDKKKVRLSLRPKIKQKIGVVTLDHVTFFQPALDDFSDYRILSHTALSTKITPQIQFGISYDYELQTVTPVPGIKKEDHTVMANITVKF
jgi:hypothetical protein